VKIKTGWVSLGCRNVNKQEWRGKMNIPMNEEIATETWDDVKSILVEI
jgi:hypothetical protein